MFLQKVSKTAGMITWRYKHTRRPKEDTGKILTHRRPTAVQTYHQTEFPSTTWLSFSRQTSGLRSEALEWNSSLMVNVSILRKFCCEHFKFYPTDCGGEINETNIAKNSLLGPQLFAVGERTSINCTWTIKAPPNKNIMLRYKLRVKMNRL